MTRVLITSALPYANGPIHLGHLVEHIQSDIYARFRRLTGDDVLFLCADDTHGTGVELNAKKLGITPEELVDRSWKEHTRDFQNMGISHDLYYTTNSPENEELSGYIYKRLKDAGHIVKRKTMQMYSESLERFLPDRWIKGTCPSCKATDQYGDQCEVCGRTYEPTDLIDPVDAIEGKKPILKETSQLYVQLENFNDFLEAWVPGSVPQKHTRNFVDRWMQDGLEAWCISRDAPYFGFEIPGEPGKYFYVWLDVPVGYIATTKKDCADRGQDWRSWWGKDTDTEIVHIIGKDIVYFHALFWPAMLHAADLKTPSRLQVHGFLTVNGEKMSKSRGTFIRVETYTEHLDPSYIRYYFGAKLAPGIEDIDLNFQDFVDRVNADLVNNAVNLASRVTKFIEARFDGNVASFEAADYPLVQALEEGLERYKAAMREFNFREGMRIVAELGDQVNTFFQDAAPWAVIKEDADKAAEICAVALHGATALMVALSPVVPNVTDRYAQALGVDALAWEHASSAWSPSTITAPKELIPRVEMKQVEAMVEASKEAGSLEQEASQAEAAQNLEPFKDEITFDDFSKLDLRVGVIEVAESVPKANKLLRFEVNIGARTIQVFSGIKSAYDDPSELIGKRVLCVVTLAPRKMRFGMSEGMLLSTSDPDDNGLQLVIAPDDAQGGWTVR